MKIITCGFFCAIFIPVNAYAGVDKIYDPYVYQGELEIEARGVHQFDDENTNKVKFAVGYGINNAVWLEGYAIAEQETGESADIEDVELESKFQLTEQGQYWADFGLLMELEKALDEDKWEFKAGPLVGKQINN